MNDKEQAITILKRKDEELNFISTFKKSWRRLFFRILMLLVALYLWFSVSENPVLLLLIGMIVGATIQDLGWIYKIKKSWPFTKKIIDWSKVESIANEDS